MKLITTFFLFLLTQTVFCQNSIIKGVTIEESSGKPLTGVNVVIKSLKKATTSDADGKFIFNGIPVGKYEIEFSFVSFETKIVSDVETLANETFDMSVSLVEMKNQLDEVVIKKVKAKAESVNSLLSMQKNSIRVSDGISAETIKKTPDRTTADVLKRISGASVQENKFVVIRGLNDRYNTSYLNGGPLPSSEPDRKAFSFDIFPANMIDNLVIYKTASPDLPGEFAGGVIEINTKATPDKNFQSLSIGSGYNTITTGKKQVYYKGGNTDWLGIDDGTRSLPSYFPTSNQFQELQQTNNQSSINQIVDIAKRYQNDWKLYEKTFSPNVSFQYTIGNNFKLKDDQNFGFLSSVTYNKNNNYNRTQRKSYETPGALLSNQFDDSYSEQVLLGILANFSLKIDQNNSFTYKNLYSINTNNRVIERNGPLSQESDPLYISSSARMFTSNEIYSGQLNGEHFLPKSKIKISWVGSYSNIKRSIPNERRNTYLFIKYDDGTQTDPFAFFQINTVGGGSPGSMFISKNAEDVYSTKIDLNRKVRFSDDFNVDFKIGGFIQSRYKDFSARQLGYTPLSGNIDGVNYNSSTFSQTIPFLDDSTIFNTENMGVISPGVSGLTLFDGTKPNDAYNASSKLRATYLMLDNSFYKFRLVCGVRIEDYLQILDSKADNGLPIRVNNSQTDILPSVNLIYSITKKQNVRLSFSKTLNRPEFRELAPFLFFDFATNFNTEGTPDLKIAQVNNADLRYEIFPGKGQLFSISAFYKKFTDPIELQQQANNTNKYKNAKSGENKGIEIEYRTLLSSIFGSENTKILDDITFFTNIAIIRSKVDISNLLPPSSTIEEIPLQGQSPYVFNAGIQYINNDSGWSAAANLNKIGDRIAFQGNQTVGIDAPALWEKGRTFLDLQISKSFLKKSMELKLNVQNILAQDLIFYENNDLGKTNVTGINRTINSIFNGDPQNKNGYNKAEDDLVFLTKFGSSFSLSLSYTF